MSIVSIKKKGECSMKNQWPFWLFVIAIAAVVVVSVKYHRRGDVVSLGDIFPEQLGAFDYEYVIQGDEDVASEDEGIVETGVAPLKAVEEKITEPNLSGQAVVVEKEKTPVVKAAVIKGSYTIQILSSKDQKALEKELKKVKDQGFADAYIQKADLGTKGIWYRIYIGQFSSMSQAREFLTKVKGKYSGAFITKL